MDIILNQQPITVDEAATLADLLTQQQIKPEGVAIAINNRIIKRTEWSATPLSQGDKVTLVQATYGG